MKIQKNIMILFFLALFMEVSYADNNETKNDNNLTSVRESNMTNRQKILALIAEKKAAKEKYKQTQEMSERIRLGIAAH